MKPLEPASVTFDSYIKGRLDLTMKSPEWWAKTLNAPVEEMTPERINQEIENAFARQAKCKVWKNDKYTVHAIDEPNGVTELSLRRNDRQPITDWRDKQQIKNQLCGPEREGMELYPAESRCVDTSNQYYIYVMPEGVKIPFGFSQGLKSEDTIGYSQQRPFSK